MATEIPPPSNETTIYTYHLTSPPGPAHRTRDMLARLRPHLPSSLPLYRRLQTGRFSDTSLALSNLDLDQAPAPAPDPAAADGGTTPEIFAFVDRGARPETEVYLFGSWESGGEAEGAHDGRSDGLVRALVRAMERSRGRTWCCAADGARAETLAENQGPGRYSRDEYGGHAGDPNIMLWGAVHERTAKVLRRLGVVAEQFKTSLHPNHTFVFELDAMPPARPLPEGLVWGELPAKHLGLVRSRTQIPRQEKTLASLPRLAVYQSSDSDGPPIAWAFVGLDGSLTTLHVEEAWRGKGIAKVVTHKLFHECMYRFWDDDGGKRIAHGYVMDGNEASANMCRSLGGKDRWRTYWVRVDLGKAAM